MKDRNAKKKKKKKKKTRKRKLTGPNDIDEETWKDAPAKKGKYFKQRQTHCMGDVKTDSYGQNRG